MSEQPEQNASEEATPFKLQRARERGAVARGMDLGFFTGLTTFLIVAWLQGREILGAIGHAVSAALVAGPQLVDSPRALLEVASTLFLSAGRPLAFAVLAIVAVVLVGEIGQLRGLVFSTTPLKPDFSRLNPAQGFKRIFSVRMLIETGKAILKLVVYSAIAVALIVDIQRNVIPAIVSGTGLAEAMVASALRLIGFFVLAAVAFAVFDQFVSRRDFAKRMRMSRREVKREHRDREGDPRLKQKRKEQHRDFVSTSQSLKGVRGADVLIVNPTHYAVALRYDPRTMDAPVIVARGTDHVAARLRRLAFSYGVVIVEAPPLARALHRFNLNQPIPDVLFAPVAGIYRKLRASRAPIDTDSTDE